jgi:Uma2 family endonuclease
MSDALAIEDVYEDYRDDKSEKPARKPARLVLPATVASFEDYARIKERCEVFDGVVYMMASPTNAHQFIAGEVFGQFREQLRGKPCRPFIAPADVELYPAEETRKPTIVQPDVFIVCDPSKYDLKGHIRGAPDFVLEVLSPSTTIHDLFIKSALYANAGVKEYWVIDYDYESSKLVLNRAVFHHTPFMEPVSVEAHGIVALDSMDISVNFDQIYEVLNQ